MSGSSRKPLRKRPWTAEEDAALIARFHADQTYRQLAQDLGRSRMGVARRLDTLMGKTIGYTRRRWLPKDDASLLVYLREGRSFREISRILGRTRSSIHTRLGMLRQQDAPFPFCEDIKSIPFVTPEDREWMNYWRLPRAVRRGLPPPEASL